MGIFESFKVPRSKVKDGTHVRISAMKPNMLGKSCVQMVWKM